MSADTVDTVDANYGGMEGGFQRQTTISEEPESPLDSDHEQPTSPRNGNNMDGSYSTPEVVETGYNEVRALSAEPSFVDRSNRGQNGGGSRSSSSSSRGSATPSRAVSAGVRLPSSKSRSHMIRTPASMLDAQGLTSSDSENDVTDDDNDSVLITELKGHHQQDPQDWDGGQVDQRVVQNGDSYDSFEDEDEVVEEEEEHREDDWDTDLEIDELVNEHDPTGRTQYQNVCEALGVVPVSYFSRHLTDAEMCMRDHGLGPAGTKAIAKVLKNNITLEKLNLSGNWMEGEGGFYMAKMLNDNDYLTDIVLADNKLGSIGAVHMTRMLANHTGLRKIDLSGNGFEDHDAEAFADAIEQNKYLKELILSRNKFGEVAGLKLGPAIGSNDILEHLDLSWNQIRRSGAVAVARGIKENIRLKSCDLSWNGFGSVGGAAIADALLTNEALVELDISGNRLDVHSAVLLAKALGKHEELRILRMGNNPITTSGCIAIAKALNESETSVLCALHLTDIPVEYEFMKLIHAIQSRRALRVVHGPVLRSGNTWDDIGRRQVDPNPKQNPLLVLREHIIINDTRIVDMLKKYDPKETYSVSTEDFAKALEELGVPFNAQQLDDIASNLKRNEDGKIYYGDIVNQIEAAGGQALDKPPVSRTSSRLSAKKRSK